MLYFGTFNPIHNGHISLAEWVIERNLCDELVLVVSPQSPFKTDDDLAPELARFEMAEEACRASKYPNRIKVSAIEFALDKPSYTINTLDYLNSNNGSEMQFSILMGADNIEHFDQWKDYERILSSYKIFVYPRKGFQTGRFEGKVTILNDAPLFDFSSTQVREAIERGDNVSAMISAPVLKYITNNNLWSPAARIVKLNQLIDNDPENADLYVERGVWYYRRNEWGSAINDFNRALKIAPNHVEAQQYLDLAYEILKFRHVDIYNP